jgi:predicted acetyltransferase
MKLVTPADQYLASYIAALERDWSPDNLRPEAGREELARIAADAAAYLARQDDPAGVGPPVTLPDGSVVPRLPGYRRWMWDGEFCGVIGFRWQRGTNELPPWIMGHIGFAVVPWKRRRGYATKALKLLLAEIPRDDFDYVELTTDVTNAGSQRVIEANGGERVETFFKPQSLGGAESFLYRIRLR